MSSHRMPASRSPEPVLKFQSNHRNGHGRGCRREEWFCSPSSFCWSSLFLLFAGCFSGCFCLAAEAVPAVATVVEVTAEEALGAEAAGSEDLAGGVLVVAAQAAGGS